MKYPIEFVVITLVVYLAYYFFMIRKYDKNGKLKKKTKDSKIDKLIEKIKGYLFKDDILLRGRKPVKVKKEEEDFKIPSEVEILLVRYKLDLSKINYKTLLKVVGFTCALDISILFVLIDILPFKNILISFAIGAVLMIPLILVSFSIIGSYYKKKGMTVKDGKHKRNRK